MNLPQLSPVIDGEFRRFAGDFVHFFERWAHPRDAEVKLVGFLPDFSQRLRSPP